MVKISLRPIKNKEELLLFIAKLPKEESTDLSPCLKNGHYQFGNFDADMDPVYFFDIVKDADMLVVNTAYINVKHRDLSKQLLGYLKELAQTIDCKAIRLSSSNMKSSYRRWIEKCGFKPLTVTYQMET